MREATTVDLSRCVGRWSCRVKWSLRLGHRGRQPGGVKQNPGVSAPAATARRPGADEGSHPGRGKTAGLRRHGGGGGTAPR